MSSSKNIFLNFSNCVHIYYKDASCQKCIDVCPIENAITKDDYKIIVNYDKCVSCGACYGVCPTQAFEIKGFDIKNLLSHDVISCKVNVPCLAVLSVEEIIWLALEKKELTLDTGHCGQCFIGTLKKHIEKTVNEANYFLQKMGVENTAVLKDLKVSEEEEKKERREFLKTFSKAAAGLTFWALMPSLSSFEENQEKEIKNIVKEKVPIEKRKLLLQKLKQSNIPSEAVLEEEKISFTSDKWIDNQKCTNCSICYNVCPTGALKAGEERLKILFEPKLCVKCRVCHDVCPENCIYLEKEFSLDTFLNDEKVLASHVMIPCEECLVPFSYKGDTTLCPRCRQLEEEVKELLGF